MNIKLLESFPDGYTPNESQQYILSEIDNAMAQGKKFIIINAPTATGKSFIAKTIANYSSSPTQEFVDACFSYKIYDPKKRDNLEDRAFVPFGTAVLTVTKALQDQYISTFGDGSVLKGKNNYICVKSETEKSCEYGKCEFKESVYHDCMREDCCNYLCARNRTVTNKCAFYTYAMYDVLPPEVKQKQFLVCDEAAELEDELVTRFTFSIIFEDLKKMEIGSVVAPYVNSSRDVFIEWVNNISSKVSLEYVRLKNKLNKMTVKQQQEKKNQKLFRRYAMLKDYQSKLEKFNEYLCLSNYIVECDSEKITFVPYEVDRLAHLLFDNAETVILMSATIVNHANFAKTLGIKDYYYIEAKSTLDPQKAPILCTKKFYVNYKNQNETIPQILEFVEKIVNQIHPNEKGIIHTHSMAIQRMVKTKFGNNSRFLFREDGFRNEQILEEHEKSSEPTILVSPSMTHGVDLKGELGKFQIILKAPYLPLGDKRIKKKFKENPEWYSDKMLGVLVQASGRCNRLHDDVAKTYIMDGVIVDAVSRGAYKLPKYFLSRFQ